ncbi:molybdate ABC transporter substrate-binding protein [Denitromonas iodatirespirans]|uniref:Molybdate ABC transporter substrate-binding protein n=1 Tax=Denitromonas iodatirespirans TaxID=2795389 RepID=A0A944DGG5_DENI1|nr:molybdate ABC transporter substrate-binding protein [Denitromonas iodatirespirans]MBT0963752.1 molybdate ABC transporter substrate-binding protein [Denitromonas iodatirespirans]
MPARLRPTIFAVLLTSTVPVAAAELTVAVASNFVKPLEAMAPVFAAAAGHQLKLSTGATGKFYAQIQRGAPFDVFLSADEKRPALLESEGRTVAGSRFVYAIGRLALWRPEPGQAVRPDMLTADPATRIAIANPKTAPYGAAAEAVIAHLGLTEALKARLVQGENIAQTYQFVATGNAAMGFVAWSQVSRDGAAASGSAWLVPADLHPPIRQSAVILTRAADNPAAHAFAAFLKSEAARKIIQQHGYDTE